MAFDKKPSMYSEHGAIGSPEELDAYGVWVKSEPQDFTAGLAEAANFDAEAIPYEADYEADFDAGFDDMGIADIGLPDFEPEIPGVSEVAETEAETEAETDVGIDIENNAQDDFDTGIITEAGRTNEEASTQLLMKIANELSMIRSELSTLKKEFAGIRVDSAPDTKAEAAHGGFFTEEEDEKIALTGDEMEDILSAADFSGGEESGYDPLREADEAALKELSEQNESLGSEPEEEASEEINIDFNNLGINLDNELEEETTAEAQEELPPLEAADDDFEIPSFDSLSFDETPGLETEELEEADQGFAEELVPLADDHEELRSLRMEGALPLTPPPDNSGYLEEDPFALHDASLDNADHEAPPLEELSLEETSLEETSLEEPSLEEPSLEETVFEEAPIEETIEETEEVVSEEPVLEETVPGEPVLEETVEEAVPEETPSADSLSVEDTPDLAFDDVSFDLDFDDFSDDASLSLEDEGDDKAVAAAPAESPAPPAEVPSAEEASAEVPSEAEASEEDEAFDAVSLDLSEDLDSSEPLAPLEETSGEENFEIESSESLAPLEDEPSASEPSADEPSEAEADDFDVGSLDLSEAVIDEPDLSAGIVEPPLEEPVLGDISFKDDISLEMDDFDAPDAKDEKADTAAANTAADIDDSLPQVIPEGFEVNAEEAAVAFDDDLEAFADDDLSIATGEVSPLDAPASEGAGGEDAGISSGLKSELKSVLSYMDHLLESLPEDKIEEFAKSEYFDTYKKIFKELGLV